MIKVTEEAMNHLTVISKANSNKVPVLGLRGGGCAGFSYEWKLIEETELDTIMFLFGTTLELKQDLMGTMLEVVNPSASSSCGCGESINFDMDKVEANQAKAVQIPD